MDPAVKHGKLAAVVLEKTLEALLEVRRGDARQLELKEDALTCEVVAGGFFDDGETAAIEVAHRKVKGAGRYGWESCYGVKKRGRKKRA